MGDGPLDLDALLADLEEPTPPGHRAGMVALAGRPNVGKSTLVNRLVGEQVAIVTEVPGTTRNAIRGVVERDDAQVVLLDTPGLAKPRSLLASRLNQLVEDSWQGVDLVLFVVDVAARVGPGDRFIAERLRATGVPVVAVANKEDLLGDKHLLLPELAELEALLDPLEVVPISAATGLNCDRLLELVVAHLPESPRLLPRGTVTDQAEHQLAAELVREAFISRMRDELPHAIAVVVEELETTGDGRVDVTAVVHVERDSQKGIVIGRGGRTIKEAGTAARSALQRLFGAPVHLDTRVKVTKNWQTDPKALRRLGY